MNWSVPLVALAALVAFQLVTVLLAYRLRPDVGDGALADADDDPAEYLDGDSVVCPQCDAENERGYRFCKHCVAELPRAMAFESGSATPFTRGIR